MSVFAVFYASPWFFAGLAVLVALIALAPTPRRGRRGGYRKPSASTDTKRDCGTRLTRRTSAGCSSSFPPGAVWEGKGFPRTRPLTRSSLPRGGFIDVTGILGANGEQQAFAGSGDAA